MFKNTWRSITSDDVVETFRLHHFAYKACSTSHVKDGTLVPGFFRCIFFNEFSTFDVVVITQGEVHIFIMGSCFIIVLRNVILAEFFCSLVASTILGDPH